MVHRHEAGGEERIDPSPQHRAAEGAMADAGESFVVSMATQEVSVDHRS